MMDGQRKRPPELPGSPFPRSLTKRPAEATAEEGFPMPSQDYHNPTLDASVNLLPLTQGMFDCDLPGPQCIGEGSKPNAA